MPEPTSVSPPSFFLTNTDIHVISMDEILYNSQPVFQNNSQVKIGEEVQGIANCTFLLSFTDIWKNDGLNPSFMFNLSIQEKSYPWVMTPEQLRMSLMPINATEFLNFSFNTDADPIIYGASYNLSLAVFNNSTQGYTNFSLGNFVFYDHPKALTCSSTPISSTSSEILVNLPTVNLTGSPYLGLNLSFYCPMLAQLSFFNISLEEEEAEFQYASGDTICPVIVKIKDITTSGCKLLLTGLSENYPYNGQMNLFAPGGLSPFTNVKFIATTFMGPLTYVSGTNNSSGYQMKVSTNSSNYTEAAFFGFSLILSHLNANNTNVDVYYTVQSIAGTTYFADAKPAANNPLVSVGTGFFGMLKNDGTDVFAINIPEINLSPGRIYTASIAPVNGSGIGIYTSTYMSGLATVPISLVNLNTVPPTGTLQVTAGTIIQSASIGAATPALIRTARLAAGRNYMYNGIEYVVAQTGIVATIPNPLSNSSTIGTYSTVESNFTMTKANFDNYAFDLQYGYYINNFTGIALTRTELNAKWQSLNTSLGLDDSFRAKDWATDYTSPEISAAIARIPNTDTVGIALTGLWFAIFSMFQKLISNERNNTTGNTVSFTPNGNNIAIGLPHFPVGAKAIVTLTNSIVTANGAIGVSNPTTYSVTYTHPDVVPTFASNTLTLANNNTAEATDLSIVLGPVEKMAAWRFISANLSVTVTNPETEEEYNAAVPAYTIPNSKINLDAWGVPDTSTISLRDIMGESLTQGYIFNVTALYKFQSGIDHNIETEVSLTGSKLAAGNPKAPKINSAVLSPSTASTDIVDGSSRKLKLDVSLDTLVLSDYMGSVPLDSILSLVVTPTSYLRDSTRVTLADTNMVERCPMRGGSKMEFVQIYRYKNTEGINVWDAFSGDQGSATSGLTIDATTGKLIGTVTGLEPGLKFTVYAYIKTATGLLSSYPNLGLIEQGLRPLPVSNVVLTQDGFGLKVTFTPPAFSGAEPNSALTYQYVFKRASTLIPIRNGSGSTTLTTITSSDALKSELYHKHLGFDVCVCITVKNKYGNESQLQMSEDLVYSKSPSIQMSLEHHGRIQLDLNYVGRNFVGGYIFAEINNNSVTPVTTRAASKDLSSLLAGTTESTTLFLTANDFAGYGEGDVFSGDAVGIFSESDGQMTVDQLIGGVATPPAQQPSPPPPPPSDESHHNDEPDDSNNYGGGGIMEDMGGMNH